MSLEQEMTKNACIVHWTGKKVSDRIKIYNLLCWKICVTQENNFDMNKVYKLP